MWQRCETGVSLKDTSDSKGKLASSHLILQAHQNISKLTITSSFVDQTAGSPTSHARAASPIRVRASFAHLLVTLYNWRVGERQSNLRGFVIFRCGGCRCGSLLFVLRCPFLLDRDWTESRTRRSILVYVRLCMRRLVRRRRSHFLKGAFRASCGLRCSIVLRACWQLSSGLFLNRLWRNIVVLSRLLCLGLFSFRDRGGFLGAGC